MMTKRTREQELASWLERVEADDQPELHTFAAGIRQDLAAVTAGLTLPYSSGATEGNVNRLKAIKRQMMAAPAWTSCANALSATLRDRSQNSRQNPSWLRSTPRPREVYPTLALCRI